MLVINTQICQEQTRDLFFLSLSPTSHLVKNCCLTPSRDSRVSLLQFECGRWINRNPIEENGGSYANDAHSLETLVNDGFNLKILRYEITNKVGMKGCSNEDKKWTDN